MQRYLIIILTLINLIIFKLINSKNFKFNQNLLNIFCILQFLIIFCIFINNQMSLFIKFFNCLKTNFIFYFK